MPLHFSAAHSSRVTKKSQAKISSLKHCSSSPFKHLNQRKPVQRSQSKPGCSGNTEDFFGDPLADLGLVKSLATDLHLRDVSQLIKNVQTSMFDAIPEGGGFNSTRISDLLNLRSSLPPTVTVSHVHALTPSPTTTEKEISTLVRAGILRRLFTPGRGIGASHVGDGLALATDIENAVRGARKVGADLAARYMQCLKDKPTSQYLNSGAFSVDEVTVLLRSGFVTSSSGTSKISNSMAHSVAGSLSIANISQGASGSIAAIGGSDAINDAGGRTGTRRSSCDCLPQYAPSESAELQVSLPGMGPYLKLLTAARSHLVSLLSRSRSQELPIYLLKERWDGGVSGDDPAARSKRYRGEFVGALPARTRKWWQFYGLAFEWVLAECVGAGLIEVFETGNVGRAARIP